MTKDKKESKIRDILRMIEDDQYSYWEYTQEILRRYFEEMTLEELESEFPSNEDNEENN